MTVSLVDLGDAGRPLPPLSVHRPALRRFFVGRLGSPARAEDATQETLTRAWQRRHSLRDPDLLVPWLFGIARHVVKEERRRGLREQSRHAPLPDESEDGNLPSPGPNPEQLYLAHEADQRAAEVVARLSPARQQALLLRIDDELGYPEIAARLGWTLPKVKNELHRARLLLKAALAVTLALLPIFALRPATPVEGNAELLACFGEAPAAELSCEPLPVLTCNPDDPTWCE